MGFPNGVTRILDYIAHIMGFLGKKVWVWGLGFGISLWGSESLKKARLSSS